jgi:hypothetical protein
MVLAFHKMENLNDQAETAVGSTDRHSYDRNSRYGPTEPCNLTAPRRGREREYDARRAK